MTDDKLTMCHSATQMIHGLRILFQTISMECSHFLPSVVRYMRHVRLVVLNANHMPKWQVDDPRSSIKT